MNSGTNSAQSSIMMEGIFFGVLCLSGCLTFSTCLLRQYHFESGAKNWTEAQSHCRETYTDLATIEDTEQMKELKDTVSEAGSMVWIGLYSHIDWKWSDGFTGSGADYRNWGGNEPNNGAKEFCVAMRSGGQWNDVGCQSKRRFTCYKGKLEDSDFVFVKTTKTWTEAQSYCREHHYTDLATVKNIGDNNKIYDMSGGKETWIGLYRDPQIYWSDGSNYSFSSWVDDRNPRGSMRQVCGVADLKQGGKWRLKSCEDRHPFVCYSTFDWCFL